MGVSSTQCGSATLKPREAKVVRTQGTDSRLVFAERRERVSQYDVNHVMRLVQISLITSATGILCISLSVFVRLSLSNKVARKVMDEFS